MDETKQRGPHIVAISGSVRPGNYTSMALALAVDEIRKQNVTVDVVDPAVLNLPPPGVDPHAEGTRQLRQTVTPATGVLLATPEYHGSFSSVMKLVIENLGFPSVLAGKPVSLLGVAAGQIGAIKSLEALAGVCLHVGAIVLPGAVSIANIQNIFDAEGRCLDPKAEERIRGAGRNLLDYIRGAVCPRLALEAMVRAQTLEA